MTARTALAGAGLFALILAGLEAAPVAAAERVSLEFKVSSFQPSGKDFRDIYKAGISFGGEVDVTLTGMLGAWAGAHYFTKDGTLTFTEEPTKIRITPFYGGLRLRFGRKGVIPYVGAGIGSFSFKEANPIGTVRGSAFGYIGQAGVIFRIGRMVFLDLKGSYTSSKANPAGIEAQLGGFLVGLGVGVML